MPDTKANNSTKKLPSYLLHKTTGRARVRIFGQDIYLGKHGTPESLARYAAVIAEFAATGLAPTRTDKSATVADVAAGYLAWATDAYQKHGQPGSGVYSARSVAAIVVDLFGDLPVADFTPRSLLAVRQKMIEKKWCRKQINRQIGRVRQMFRRGVVLGLVEETTWRALAAVEGIRKGATGVKDNPKVRPVDDARIEAVRPHVAPVVWAMIQLQRLTGMRGGEVVIMRGIDLDVSGEVWTYTPSTHKTEHAGRDRIIDLGPRAREIVAEYLTGDASAFLFRPARGQGSRGGTHYRKRPRGGFSGRLVGDRYTTGSYRRAIVRACKKAGVAKWTPHQLRHTYATEVRRQYGIEAARILLGHASVVTTEIYAEADRRAAQKVALAIG